MKKENHICNHHINQLEHKNVTNMKPDIWVLAGSNVNSLKTFECVSERVRIKDDGSILKTGVWFGVVKLYEPKDDVEKLMSKVFLDKKILNKR